MFEQIYEFELSPSLRGSGLKSKRDKNGKLVKNVSLFTREWIEIFFFHRLPLAGGVSLFTREWIEIDTHHCNWWQSNCLPLYEGVD